MAGLIYIVQPFSRDPSGALVWDAPAWSQDRSFAVALAQALERRKSGVLTLAAAFDPSGALAEEAAFVAGAGSLPTSLVLPALRSGARRSGGPASLCA